MNDEELMASALEQARTARDQGDVPIGCVVARHGVVIAAAHNARERDTDPTAHAEILALRAAALATGDRHLGECTLYVTLEPCAMCAGAIVLSRVARLVYGAPDPKAGAVESLYNIVQDSRLNHVASVTGGILADESAFLLRSFFAERRIRES
ncbi:MAG: tRNA adenosine(34) deaminase TadA [Actinomycetota bacterium]|nr:tRNA adenosine(34) deaminase TadA [Actinomycetota bacterium]